MNFLKLILLGLLFSLTQPVGAQQKHEYETGIDKNNVPLPALRWFDEVFEKARKTSWYRETSEDGLTFEAKCKWEGKWHSVEFDSIGQLQDVEVTIRFKELPKSFREAFEKLLEENYQKSRILKIQRQWSGQKDQVLKSLNGQDGKATLRYEIEYYGKTDEKDSLWEGLFDEEGRLIQKREIILQNADNLTY